MEAEEAGEVLWLRCRGCQGMVFRREDGPSIVIGHESEDIAEQIALVLADSGLSPARGANGEQVLQLVQKLHPPAIVIDVALDNIPTFKLVDVLHDDEQLSAIKVILVASVFRKTAYKRRPQSLYGAHDYVEQHHIPDRLVEKIAHLANVDIAGLQRDIAERRDALEAVEERFDLAGLLRVRALAHSIVADIALYHQTEFENAVRGETDGLIPALDEGRRLLAEMVGGRERDYGDPIGDAFGQFLEEMCRSSR